MNHNSWKLEFLSAFRNLRSTPFFSVGAIAVLALAIVGTSTVSTVWLKVMIAPNALADREDLIHVSAFSEKTGISLGYSPALIEELKVEDLIEEVAVYRDSEQGRSVAGDYWTIARISGNLLAVFDQTPILGRPFVPTDVEYGAPRTALLSEAAWKNRFASNESVVGSVIELADGPATIVGVLPGSFSVPSQETDVWLPLTFSPEDTEPDQLNNFRSGHVILKLPDTVSAQDVRQILEDRYGQDSRIPVDMNLTFRVSGLRDAWSADQVRPLAIMGLATTLMLLAAFFNLSGLWSTRLTNRSHEYAVRYALGATRARRLCGIFLEYGMIGACAAVLAFLLTPFSITLLRQLSVLDSDSPIDVRADETTVLIAISFAALGFLFVAIAAITSRPDQRATEFLRHGGRTVDASGTIVQNGLVVVQIALAICLLCTLGALLRSWLQLVTEDLGFETSNVATVRVFPSRINRPAGDSESTSDLNVRVAIDQIRAHPDVDSVTFANVAPFTRADSFNFIPEPNSNGDSNIQVRTRSVGIDFFETMGIPLLAGRLFELQDGHDVILVDRRYQTLYFDDGQVLGNQVRVAFGNEPMSTATIVGVVGTTKNYRPSEQPNFGTIYRLDLSPPASSIVLYRSSANAPAVANDIDSILLRELGHDRFGQVLTMSTLIRDTLRDRLPQVFLIGFFGAETLLLVGVGLFSVLSFVVHSRSREFVIRRVLGATPNDVRRLIYATSLRVFVPGIVLGFLAAWVVAGLLASELYNVSTTDFSTWAIVLAFVSTVVVIATHVPARIAGNLSLVHSLHHD